MNTILKWTGAILLSLLAHAGATQLFEPNEEPQELALVAGGEAMEVAVLGNAFEETVLSGDPTEAIEPDEAEPEEIVPEPTEVAEVPPVQSEVTAETPSDIVPTEADVILPAEEIVEAVTAQPEITATVAAVETVVPQEKPDIKPEPEKKAEPKKEPEKEKPKKKVVKKRAGDAGKQVETAVKGQADGVEGAAATASTGKKGKVAQAFGNAAESNYKGKVRSRVQRYFRFPRSADRAGLGGTVTVSFTVSTVGGVSGVRIVKGSGSPVLDEAAINAVRKAEPFPKIPEAANRTSWLFTIPLQFAR
ncbi:energy transducer TonB [Pararhizobium qamdonense]|uniref:energy transducer TonB n=1 Tax=Pararhizobium qamdonense TaxID=3031126 RepID=UPI0023E1C216|nr:energy transducer TonB [Pararhizobium qamdonense]